MRFCKFLTDAWDQDLFQVQGGNLLARCTYTYIQAYIRKLRNLLASSTYFFYSDQHFAVRIKKICTFSHLLT